MTVSRHPAAGPLASSISVIIPTLNEEGCIAATLKRLRSADLSEVIVVDGGSADGTVRIAEDMGAITLSTSAGRGRQQNLGAERSSGDILLFLHADTTLPSDFPSHVRGTLATPGTSAGAFQFRLDTDGWGLALVERMVALRCAVFAMPYGDQAIFTTREAFELAGRFKDLPVMEDFDLIRRLKRIGRVRLAPTAAVTSARRWRREGVLLATLKHQVCILGYYLGVRPELLARLRGRIISRRSARPTGKREARTIGARRLHE